jgi:MFS family permease
MLVMVVLLMTPEPGLPSSSAIKEPFSVPMVTFVVVPAPAKIVYAWLDVQPVIRNRDALALIAGYAATIWGTAGLRQWIVVFLAFCAAGQAGAVQGWSMMWAGALIGLLGVPAGLLGNELALRVGFRMTAMGVFALSAVVNLLFGFSAVLPYEAILVLGTAAGFIAQGNFSNLTSGVLMVADPRHRGATVALYSCIGFAGGFGGTLVFGIALDQFGGAGRMIAWVVAFGTCGAACLVGCAATVLLARELLPPDWGVEPARRQPTGRQPRVSNRIRGQESLDQPSIGDRSASTACTAGAVTNG